MTPKSPDGSTSGTSTSDTPKGDATQQSGAGQTSPDTSGSNRQPSTSETSPDGSQGSSSEKGSATPQTGTSDPSATKSGGDTTGSQSTTQGGQGSGAAKSSGQTTTNTQSETTNTNISVEQRTEIQQVVKEVHVEPVEKADFSISVGTSVPRTIHLEPLPTRIVEIVPQYKSYKFFVLADGRIVIVDPNSFAIVYIIEA
jgi:hypothetical protein